MEYFYDIVWLEYQCEHDLTVAEMQEKQHVDAMLKRVDKLKWQEEQRAMWMCGEKPQYKVPDDCPF
tara:strand:+ start:1482 stop:1679 length:198 start_codon:yes stop_codon:yes gene_type:complete